MIQLVFLAVLLPQPDVDQWPGFLGADASPIDPQSIPLGWSPERNIAWQAPIPGYGQSSPVIFGDRVFVTSVDGPNKEACHVVCLSLENGERLWDRSIENSNPEENSLYISRAAPTPVVDENYVFAYFEGGDVVALAHDGTQIWHQSLTARYGKPTNRFGLAASPVLTDEQMIILVDDDGPSYLVALNRKDGGEVWKTDRTSRTSWSSPALMTIDGVQQVICSSDGSVDAYDPRDGNRLWSFENIVGNTSSTPMLFGANQFLVGASPGRDASRTTAARDSNLAMQIVQADGQWIPTVSWKANGAMPSFGSPMVHNGLAYWVNRQGVVYCLDAQTGEEKYAERTKESTWATPLGLGDRICIFGKEGVTTVLAAGPEFKVLAENRLWEADNPPKDTSLSAPESTPDRQRGAATFGGPTQYGVAAVSGSLLIRTGTVLYCVRAE